jgi:hypothetical protein
MKGQYQVVDVRPNGAVSAETIFNRASSPETAAKNGAMNLVRLYQQLQLGK